MNGETRPNTIEEWYLDALKFLRARYSFLPELEREEVEARFAVKIAKERGKYNPEKCVVWVWLCWKVRGAYHDHREKKARSRDLMIRGVNVTASDPEEAEGMITMQGVQG